MRVSAISGYNYQPKLQKKVKINNQPQAESEVSFQGRCRKTFLVMGTAFGACFGPATAVVGAYLGDKFGKMVEDGSEEFKKSGFDTDDDPDPDNYAGR